MSLVDKIVKRLVLTNFFGDGWGDQETFQKLMMFKGEFKDAANCSYRMESLQTPGELNFTIKEHSSKSKHVNTYSGSFDSPLVHNFPDLMPVESNRCNFHMILPCHWHDPHRRVCLLYAPTGDHTYWRRAHFLAHPLAKEYNIGSVIVENPFYGSRKPQNQVRSGIRQVTDLFIMGCALMLEGQFLFRWLEDSGYDRLGISGISLGGHNASLTACTWRRPIATVPCLSWSTAAHSFSEGIISNGCMWDILHQQLSPGKLDEIHTVIRKTDKEIQDLLVKRLQANSATKKSRFTLSDIKYISTLTNSLGSIPSSLGTKAPDKLTSLYMRLVVDEFSNLRHYPVPARPECAIVVVAKDDLYVTRPEDADDILHIQDVWPGCEIRTINGGHITSYLSHNHTFRRAINDAFDKLDKVIENEENERHS